MRQAEKDPALLILQEHPLNAAPPLERLYQAFVTPNEHFFVRNHGGIPQIDSDGYALTITGMVERPLRLTLADLARFPRRTVTATLMCAGNRRSELVDVAPIPDELLWGAGAISNATWEGIALRDVLVAAGVGSNAAHVAFTGLDEIEKQGEQFGFGSSIPLEKALATETLLASSMNGALLAPEHGFPLRVVVPGYIGARSVKWLANIHLQQEPSNNYYQARAYKLFPPHITAAIVDWSQGTMLGEAPITAAICIHDAGKTPDAPVVVCGYAYAGGRGVARVEVAWDAEALWSEAELAPEHTDWSWRLWRIAMPRHATSDKIVMRAWDSAGECQPERLADVWNFKGYLNNAWQTRRIGEAHETEERD